MRKKIISSKKDKKYDVNLTYITSRGSWYNRSWKGDINKSGGIATNIGIHFFDMLYWLFGDIQTIKVKNKLYNVIEGFLEFENARVNYLLSIDSSYLPKEVIKNGESTFRSISINNDEIEFSGGFKDLHTKVYEDIIKGNGYGLEDARKSIEIVHQIRNS